MAVSLFLIISQMAMSRIEAGDTPSRVERSDTNHGFRERQLHFVVNAFAVHPSVQFLEYMRGAGLFLILPALRIALSV